MAFTIDTAHIPSGLELPTGITATSGLSDTTVSIVDKITTSPRSLFENPMVNATNFMGDAVIRVDNHLKSVADGSLISSSITQAQAVSYLSTDPLQDIRTSLGNFLMHTGRLSGILRSFGTEAPGLQQIISIGSQMQTMMTLLQAGSGCLPVIGGATGLFSQDVFDGHTRSIAALMTRLERGLATVADITDIMNQISTAIRGIMSKDSQFLENTVRQLQSAALGLAMEAINQNPCGHFILDTITNTNPGGVLNILAKSPI